MIRCLVAVLFLSTSVFLLIVANLYDVSIDEKSKTISSSQAIKNSDWVLDDNPENILWFLQISDLHISKFKDPTRISDFNIFCSEVLDVVKPKIVKQLS